LRNWSAQNLDRSPSAAWYCGRVMEYNWHILLANTSFISKCYFCQGDFYWENYIVNLSLSDFIKSPK
jgi:hypothetical protein